MLSNTTQRADVTATSPTTIQFAAAAALTTRPIRLWALSGRQAALTTPPAPLTISGAAGIRYLYALLAAPPGNPYSTDPGGTLHHILNDPTSDEVNWYNAFRAVHPGDGTLIDPAINSPVSLVETGSPTPPDAHHVSLAQFEVVAGAIASLSSYEGQVALTVAASNHGQCELIQPDGNTLTLRARGGQALIIEGVTRNVPVAGVTLAPAGLTAGYMYYIYATWVSPNIVLVPATTGPTTHTNGILIQSGDPTRTYVGKQIVAPGNVWHPYTPVQSRFHPATPTTLIRATGNPLREVVNTASETSIFGANTPAIEGGVLGTDEFLELIVLGDFLNNTTVTHGFEFRVYYGNALIMSIVASADFTAHATRRGWHFYGYLAAAGSTGAQTARGHWVPSMDTTGGITGGTGSDLGGTIYHSSHSAIAVDSTTGQYFNVTVQNDFASPLQSIRVFSAILRRMRR